MGVAGPQAESINFQGRMETIYEFGKPFADKRKPIMILDPQDAAVPSGFLGVKKSDVW